MFWYSHLFKSFPQFVMIHTVKGFSIVNETGRCFFVDFPYFLYDPENVCNLIFGSSVFSKPSLDIWKFLVHVMLKPNRQDFKHDLKIHWRREWQTTPVHLVCEPHELYKNTNKLMSFILFLILFLGLYIEYLIQSSQKLFDDYLYLDFMKEIICNR